MEGMRLYNFFENYVRNIKRGKFVNPYFIFEAYFEKTKEVGLVEVNVLVYDKMKALVKSFIGGPMYYSEFEDEFYGCGWFKLVETDESEAV